MSRTKRRVFKKGGAFLRIGPGSWKIPAQFEKRRISLKDKLEIGSLMSGQKFYLPLDLVTRTLAIIAIRGWGKTVAATVIAEEMCEAGLPWVAIDPVGVWWGLRANPDGSPGGYPVVILGGEHGDLPLEKSAGAKVAEAVLQENVSCVIDMSSESKNTVRHFVADFCDRLMELRPEVPRHIFIEEAPELVPQKPMGEQKRSLAAVDRLIRLGRNRGYGATLISQRTATIQKDVLTQCESLLAGRSIGKPDRVAMQDWIAEVVGVPSPTDAGKFVNSLSSLESGTGWFWSPQWLDVFKQIRVRRRKSYHPGATRSVGESVKQVQLSDVRDFVERFGKVLQDKPSRGSGIAEVSDGRHKKRVNDGDELTPSVSRSEYVALDDRVSQAQSEAARLRAQVAELHQRAARAESVIASLREQLEPEYRALQKLFGELQQVVSQQVVSSNQNDMNVSVTRSNSVSLGRWKAKLGKGVGLILDLLVEHSDGLTRQQLRLLSGGFGKSTVNEYLNRAKRAGLVVESDEGLLKFKSLNRTVA